MDGRAGLLANPDDRTTVSAHIVCQKCGLNIKQQAPGSFTQWVFKESQCNCEEPAPTAIRAPLPAAGHVSGQDAQSQLSAEDEAAVGLDLEPDKFPVERYKPLLVIDKGSSGTVYCCADRLLAKRVAIKTLHHVLEEQLLNFQREAKTTSRLVHNNIVQTLDFGVTSGGVPYMVMELISGESLKTKIERTGPLPPHIAIHLIHAACLGLTHAHANGILHRDVKTKNIMVLVSTSDYPDAKLIDFGIASHEMEFKANDLGTDDGDSNPSSSSTTYDDMSKRRRGWISEAQGVTIVGTPSYMSPDQALGRKYDERSEVYSLGCCLFEALTGELPFEADSPLELIQKHASEPSPKLANIALEGSFSDELEAVVKKCLNKSPAERYQTTAELASALKALPDYSTPNVPSNASSENDWASAQNKKQKIPIPVQPEWLARFSLHYLQ
jgi:Serine/threonine protein kinase